MLKQTISSFPSYLILYHFISWKIVCIGTYDNFSHSFISSINMTTATQQIFQGKSYRNSPCYLLLTAYLSSDLFGYGALGLCPRRRSPSSALCLLGLLTNYFLLHPLADRSCWDMTDDMITFLHFTLVSAILRVLSSVTQFPDSLNCLMLFSHCFFCLPHLLQSE